ncbi:MAG: signal recognition particle protein [Alphaproteobacteria bacterium TMED89]|nr:signal recognition particle protein [Rhodospirillaceae bacterium]RPH12616.1 MAG: signal recognition particle protein [Alphaproteobacteria bacterium TMED89]
MFEGLSNRLEGVFNTLRGRGKLSEADVSAAAREIRIALLEADVALPVAKDLISKVKERAVGEQVLSSVTPGQQVVKIVHDALVETLTPPEGEGALKISGNPPVPILMVGLQGSGKTTTSAKIALRLTNRDKKRVLLASLDVHRPAAQEQLRVLGEQTGVDSLAIVAGEGATAIAERAMREGRSGGYDVVILDTAGRLTIDDVLMDEVVAVRDLVKPHETLLVADAMTGQDAVTTATAFDEKVGITGLVLTRVDGDSRGGAALSMRGVTGKPVKLLGMGEKMDALEAFQPERIAGRILGMGDVVSLVEKAAEAFDENEAKKMARKLKKGSFDLTDLRNQFQQMNKMGGIQGLMSMLPGAGQMKKQMTAAGMDERKMKHQIAIIDSMTLQERTFPNVIKANRKKRIAAGSGTSVQQVNELLKQFDKASKMMKRMKKMGGKGGLPGMPGGAGMPDMGNMDPAELQEMLTKSGLDPKSLPKMPGGLPPGFKN